MSAGRPNEMHGAKRIVDGVTTVDDYCHPPCPCPRAAHKAKAPLTELARAQLSHVHPHLPEHQAAMLWQTTPTVKQVNPVVAATAVPGQLACHRWPEPPAPYPAP